MIKYFLEKDIWWSPEDFAEVDRLLDNDLLTKEEAIQLRDKMIDNIRLLIEDMNKKWPIN